MELVAVMLALVVLAAVTVTITGYAEQAAELRFRNILIAETAQEQVTFAWAVANYLEQTNLTVGAIITPAILETAGDLPPGFSPTNPLNQTPVAYVGVSSTALVTYTGVPDPNILAGLGIPSTSSIATSGLAAQIIFQASEDAEPYASKLVAVEVKGNAASSPYGGQQVTLTSFFTGYPSIAEPTFSILVNLDSAYSGVQTP